MPSLRATTDLTQLEIVVIDMGLRSDQREILAQQTKVITCELQTHPTAARFATIEQYLRMSKHQVAMLIDGGDILFQSDILPAFKLVTDRVLAAQCVSRGLFYEWFLPNCFSLATAMELYRLISLKPAYSAGVIVGKRDLLIDLLSGMNQYLEKAHHYGADQIVMNYVGHRDNLIADLPATYNFSSLTGWEQFAVKKGKVYDAEKRLIAIVHNAGRIPLMRVFGGVGYLQKNATLNYAGLWIRRIFSPGIMLLAWLLGKINTRLFG